MKKDSESLWLILDKYSVLFSVLVFLLSVGFFYLLLFTNQIKQIRTTKNNVIERENQITDSRNYLSSLDSLYSNYEKFKGRNLDKLDMIAPEGEQLPDLIVWLETLARENGLQLLNMVITRQSEEELKSKNKKFLPGISSAYPDMISKKMAIYKNYEPGVVNINLTLGGGDYFALKHFFNGVEKSLRIMDILSFNYTPKAKDYSIALKAYLLRN